MNSYTSTNLNHLKLENQINKHFKKNIGKILLLHRVFLLCKCIFHIFDVILTVHRL